MLLDLINFCFECANREEQSEIDVTSGFYVLFGSGKNLHRSRIYYAMSSFITIIIFMKIDPYELRFLSVKKSEGTISSL